jgi:hypothetical protein
MQGYCSERCSTKDKAQAGLQRFAAELSKFIKMQLTAIRKKQKISLIFFRAKRNNFLYIVALFSNPSLLR